MLEEIKAELADNFREGDDTVLQNLIDRVTTDALSISNRVRNTNGILNSNIIKCVKEMYLQRGSEGSNSLSDGGISTSFNNPKETMRKEIVAEGKRLPRL